MSVEPSRAAALLQELPRWTQGQAPPVALQRACALLRHRLHSYSWVGVYLLEGETLRLVAWDGSQPTEHVRIPLDRGVCGRAARERRVVNVPDVRASAEYLACFRETRSEIVVPIFEEDRVIGEIDVDGGEVSAYDGTDEQLLVRVAERLAPMAGEVRAHFPDPPIGPARPGYDPAPPS